MISVTVEDAKRLLTPEDFSTLQRWFKDELPGELASAPQPPPVGAGILLDDKKLAMLDHVLAIAGKRRAVHQRRPSRVL